MKRVSMLLFFFSIPVFSHAAVVHVLIPNYDSYGRGMICVVDQEYNSRFDDLIHASGINTDRTSRETAFKLVGFFKEVDKDACYDPKGTSQHINVPNRSTVYVVTIVLTPDGAHAYWNVTNLDASGGLEQYVTVDAPSL